MGRVAELAVGVSALCGILTFLGFRQLFRAAVRNLGRPAKNGEEFKFDDQDEDIQHLP